MSIYKVYYKNEEIPYTVERKKVKNINLRITSALEVKVSAHKSVPLNYIHQFVESKAQWIIKHLSRKKRFRQTIVYKKLISGETLKYLGSEYPLEVHKKDVNKMTFDGKKFCLYSHAPKNYTLKKKIYEEFFKRLAKTTYKVVLNQMYNRMESYDIIYPKMTIRKMKTRWGSCNANKGKINMNFHLIKAPLEALEYVMLHELVHLVHPNHSKAFYEDLEKIMPDYVHRKQMLSNRYINEL